MQYILNGHSLVLDQALCNGCGRCEEVCPQAVFSVVGRKAVIANRGNCMECGACRMNCPLGAIQVSSGVGCAAAISAGMRNQNAGCADACACD
ncbi:MAG: 4Fe-4S binding protein [Bryobacteraceae bacterium]|jgi:NAD-dependent dihydropyrimidine dehydrogenase PreA subunit